MDDCQRKKTSPLFGGQWLSVQQSPSFNEDILISSIFLNVILHRKLQNMFNFH